MSPGDRTPCARFDSAAPLRRLASLAALLPAIGLAIVAGSCGRSSKPDVILITIDTLRWDRVGCYGYTEASTPHLDRLAAEGIRFERAVTPVPLTLPSHTSILTGLLPLQHGVHNNGSYQVPGSAYTLAEHFQAAGYRTGAFVSAFVLNAQFGLRPGFEAYDDSLFNERAGTETVRRALRWYHAKDRRPAFLWVHLWEPHTPWNPPLPYATMALPSGYDREVAAVDGAIGELLEDLRRAGRYDRSVILVTGDHGEGLGDHGEAEHGVFLYQETTRVPFLLKKPRQQEAGRVVSQLVATIDVAPTLCELAGVEPLKGIDGQSLVALAAGGAPPQRSGVYLETVYPRENFGWSSLAAFENDRWKWISAPEPELYQLVEDPGELDNRSTAMPDTAAAMDRRLERTKASARPLAAEAHRGPSAEVTERLRSLGYLSAGSLAPAQDEDLPDPKHVIATLADFDDAKRGIDDGRYHEAIAPFQRVIAGHGRNLVALLGLGMAYNRTARFPEAESTYRAALQLSSSNSTAIAGLADALFGQEKWKEAAELYELAIPSGDQVRHLHSRLAVSYVMLGRAEDARALLDRARRTIQADPRFLDDLTVQLRDYQQATPAAGDSLRLARARAAAGLGLFRETERLLQTPAERPAGEIQRLSLLEQLYTQACLPDRALGAVDRLAEATGEGIDLRLRRAQLLLSAGRPAEALAVYRSIPADQLAAGGRQPTVLYNQACALARLRRNDEAVQTLEEAIRTGYDNLAHLLNDEDLSGLRDDPGYLRLVSSLSARP